MKLIVTGQTLLSKKMEGVPKVLKPNVDKRDGIFPNVWSLGCSAEALGRYPKAGGCAESSAIFACRLEPALGH
jgi:hypothetical protein